jgi:hypothetical protein
VSDPREIAAHRALRRLLANGRLVAVPKRPADQALLAELAATQFDADAAYVESDVNDCLRAWLATISEPFGIDHVTLRRMLVDAGLLRRTSTGSAYRVNAQRLADIDAVRNLDPARVLAEIRHERDRRKRQRET